MQALKNSHIERKILLADRLPQLLAQDAELARRFADVRGFSAKVRACEYHLTNACNIRCEGCWFFEFGHDKSAKESKHLDAWIAFTAAQRKRRVNCALLIGGEPTLFPERVEAFVNAMRYVSISTNGLKAFPNVEPFRNVTVFISLFGGGALDDELRAIKPGGKRFSGLFDTALKNYQNDPRATFVYAVTEDGLCHIESTVKRIHANGNVVSFNFYSKYNTGHPLRMENGRRLLAEMLRVQEQFPRTVLNHRTHMEAMITGRTWCGEFGYDTCPSVSQDHPENAARLQNGHPTLPFSIPGKLTLRRLNGVALQAIATIVETVRRFTVGRWSISHARWTTSTPCELGWKLRRAIGVSLFGPRITGAPPR